MIDFEKVFCYFNKLILIPILLQLSTWMDSIQTKRIREITQMPVPA